MSIADTVDRLSAYRLALLDWLACASAARDERAARSVASTGGDLFTNIAYVGTAGHLMDYDDTLPEGVAHVSAAVAPAALVLAAHLGLTVGETLQAYAQGFEAMADLARASHPALYSRGWHPTAVCGPVGAAVAAASLLGLTDSARETAVATALLGASGTRGAFGSDGKSVQVGLAAAAGVRAALVARGGANVGDDAVRGKYGFEDTFGATVPADLGEARTERAIERNWVKLYPSCLGTHAAIDAALAVRAVADGSFNPGHDEVNVAVHPVGRQAAHRDAAVDDGLSAKFSIHYCVAHAFLKGAPRRSSFESIDPSIAELAGKVVVTLDESLPEFGASLRSNGRELLTVRYPRGAPGTDFTAADLETKIRDLAGDRLVAALDDLDAEAAFALSAAGFAFE